MTPETAVLMAQYNRWMNDRLYQAAAGLAQEQLMRDAGAFFGSLFHTLNHVAAGDLIWLHRLMPSSAGPAQCQALQALPRPDSLRHVLATQLDELRQLRQRLDALILDWASGLTQAQLAQSVAYRNLAGQAQAKNLGALVQHFFNHQTHHRGQATTLFSQAGVDVGVTDLLALIPDAAV
jgi:uncharacterized damage-inducible protein DinB